LGYTLIILSAVILTTTFKKKKFLFNKLRFWTLLGIIGFVLALGGQLKFFGQVYNFKLPYYYIYKIVPLFWASGRFVLLTFISLSILCTIGLSALLENLSDRKRYLIYMCVLILIILEFLSIPYPLKSYKVSDFYYELGKEKGDFAVYDLSHRYNSDYIAASGLHMYYQTIHNKKIIDGRISRNPLSSLKYAMQGPPLLELEKLNIKYVILPKESNLSESFSNYSLVFKDQEIKVYQIFK